MGLEYAAGPNPTRKLGSDPSYCSVSSAIAETSSDPSLSSVGQAYAKPLTKTWRHRSFNGRCTDDFMHSPSAHSCHTRSRLAKRNLKQHAPSSRQPFWPPITCRNAPLAVELRGTWSGLPMSRGSASTSTIEPTLRLKGHLTRTSNAATARSSHRLVFLEARSQRAHGISLERQGLHLW